MSGFDNETVYANNWDFRGVQPVLPQVTVAGQLPIGTGGSPAILVGEITSPGGTITVGYSSPNITLDLAGGSTAIDSVTVDNSSPPGTNPVLPTAGGNITITGAQVVASSLANVIQTNSTAANSFAVTIQRSSAVAASDTSKNGVSHFDSAAFDVNASGFVQLNGGGIAATAFDVQANTAPGTDPVVPTAAGLVTVNGAAVANHSVVLETRSRAANAYNLEVQYAAAAAATDATKSGVAHFDSASFSVDANGFVTTSGGGGFTWNDVSGAFSPLRNNGYFITGTATGTLPAAPAQGDTVKFFVDHASQVLTIQATAGKIIRLGSLVSSSGGTAVSTVQGDSVELTYRTSDTCWCAIAGFTGTWVMA